MRYYFRLLPMTIGVAALLLVFKVAQGVELGQSVFSSLFVSPVVAADSQPPQPPQPTNEAGNAEEGGDEGEEEPKPKAKVDDDDDIFGGFLKVRDNRITADDLIGNQLGGLRPSDRRFSPVELQQLQQLSSRRKDLDKRQEQLEIRENLLTQTEKRVDEKFTEMKSLRMELADIISQYKEVEETKIKSLVKIYENMKPKDAARIFDQLELPILMMVIDKMSEKKAAPIIASMDPKIAKRLTVELAEQRKMEDEQERKSRLLQQ